MKIPVAAIIQARCGSTRFPAKVLQPVEGKPLLEILLHRVREAKELDGVIVATTGAPEDDAIETLCLKLGVPVIRGSEKDVLDRYYRAAAEFQVETVVRLTSDCPLMDPCVIDQIVKVFKDGRGTIDFVANTAPPPGTFPSGMDVEVFSAAHLRKAWLEAEKPSEREHVTFYFWKNPDKFRLHQVQAPKDWSGYRLTVDYPDDLAAIQALYTHFQKNKLFGHLEEMITFLEQNPKVHASHPMCEGWNPSLQADSKLGSAQVLKAPALDLTETEKAWARAKQHIPTGSQTFSKAPNQYVDGVAPKMLYRGKGSKVWDLDGNEYIDYNLGLGPAILGHSHSEVNQAAARAQTLFSVPPLPHPMESELAEKLSTLIPSAENVRFGKNGSDVTAGAVRLARAFTGRDIIACCGYHGWQDWYIGSTTRNLGVPKAVRELTLPFQYNQLESLEKIFKDHPGQVAAVILEPVTFVLPQNDFLKKVRDLCTREKTVLIFDEIITGFRLHIGGAQTYFGVTPDLSTFGKAISNGFPLSALCGKAEIMRLLEQVFFSFTFGGELPSIAAALKTIEILERDQILPEIARLGRMFREGFNAAARELNMPYASCIGLDFWPEYEFKALPNAGVIELLSLFQQEFVRRGVLTRAALFISAAHSSFDIQTTLRAAREALSVVAAAVAQDKVRAWLDGKPVEPVFRLAQPTPTQKT